MWTVVFEVRPVVVTASPSMIPRSERNPCAVRAAGGATLVAMPSAEERREELKAVYRQASVCTRCPQLASTRQTVVFGSGNADADLMFVGEAPGANEDKQGVPFVGQAGKLLDQLLGEIGLTRPDVFVVNVLKCLQVQRAGPARRRQLGADRSPRQAAVLRGTVMSVDDAGRLLRARVTGWHETPLGESFAASHELPQPRAPQSASTAPRWISPATTPCSRSAATCRSTELRPGDRVATGQGLSALARDVGLRHRAGRRHVERPAPHMSASATRSGRRSTPRSRPTCSPSCRLARRSSRVAGGGRRGAPQYDVVQVRTLAHRAVGVLRREFYADRKRVPPWLERLAEPEDARDLVHGSTATRGSGRHGSPLAEIATNGFSRRRIAWCSLKGLLRLGLPAKASRGRLYFDVNADPPALGDDRARRAALRCAYKLHPEVECGGSLRSGAASRLGRREVMYDEVEVEEIEPGADRDVLLPRSSRRRHNFVTAGGVVAQLPASRQPRSAAAGDRQLPGLPVPAARADRAARSSARSGNFADEAAARRPVDRHHELHGREEIRVIGPRAVRLFPIYHPAAALYTRSLLDTLRADFARLPALLALDPPPQPEPPEPEPIVEEPELRGGDRGAAPELADASRASLSSRPSALRALVDRERVALVVAPLAADQQVARRVALEAEAGAARERDRGGVAGLDVGLDAVQRERAERVVEDLPERRARIRPLPA